MVRSTHVDDERFLNAIDRLSRRMTRVQLEISSGKRMHDASDDPDSIDELLTIRADLSKIGQIQQNLNHFKTETDTAEKALSDSVKILERARVLAAQGVTGTQTAETRRTLAVEVRNLTQQLTGLANSNVGGRFIFSGDSDSVAPFTFTAGPPMTVSTYAGTPPTRQVLGPTGQTFPVAKAGDEIFANTDPTRNAFANLIALNDALEANDPTAIGTALTNITTSGEHMNLELAFYGAAQNNVSDAQTMAQDMKIRLETQLTATEDADLVSSITEMSRMETARDAAFAAHAQFPKRSLFDYLA